MSDLMIAPVTGTGTREAVVDALVGHLHNAYLNGDLDSVILFGRQILEENSDEPDTLFARVTARLFTGWATMVEAMKAATVDVNLYRKGLQEAAREIESVIPLLLEHEELFAERITAECYLALIDYHLGDTEGGARKLELVQHALDVRSGVGTKVRGIYITTLGIIARNFLGFAAPSLGADAAHAAPAAKLDLPPAAHVEREPLGLNDEIRQQCAVLMEQGDARGMLEITDDLVHIDPGKLTPESWSMIRRWHVWALVALGEEAEGSARHDYFTLALPLLRELADEAFTQRHTETFVAMATELTIALRVLGDHDEADMRWKIVCVFVNSAPEPIKTQLYDNHVVTTQDRIQKLGLANNSRILPVA